MKCVFWPEQIRAQVFFFFFLQAAVKQRVGGGAGEVNTSTEPRNKAETTCPPSGDR